MNDVVLDDSGCPLVVEQLPDTYDGYRFLTLIQFRSVSCLAIVDTRTASELRCYVLDLCGPTETDLSSLLRYAIAWQTDAPSTPFSVYLTNQRANSFFDGVLRTYNIEYVTRVVGRIPESVIATASTKIARRRIRTIKTRQSRL